jgi:1-aminocyclopropane-1-carboxylate deaminase
MGGAFSNHLSATAFACNEAGLQSAGIIRGEIIQPLNSTLSFCEQMQMQIIPVERKDYNRNSETVEEIRQKHDHLFFVPEGGDNEEGLKGCKEILSMIPDADSFTHILCCMGTGATFKGIASSAKAHQKVFGIPVLKIRTDETKLFIQQHATIESAAEKQVLFDHAGDGYAKISEEQINFMNSFYTKTAIPTDIVYTGKLMQAIISLAEQHFFEAKNKILVLHTGGLQGNSSLKPGTLLY